MAVAGGRGTFSLEQELSSFQTGAMKFREEETNSLILKNILKNKLLVQS